MNATLTTELLSADFLKFFLPLAGAVVAWFVNERRRQRAAEYERKEKRYGALLRALPGFYSGSRDPIKTAAFLEQLNLCWLYCPDEVIENAYALLESMKSGAPETNADREALAGAFVASVRRDLLSRRLVRRTRLGPRDFKILGVSPGPGQKF